MGKNFKQNTINSKKNKFQEIKKQNNEKVKKITKEIRKDMALGLPHKKFDRKLKAPKLNLFKQNIINQLERKNNLEEKQIYRLQQLKHKDNNNVLNKTDYDVEQYELKQYLQYQEQQDEFISDKKENSKIQNQQKFKKELKKLVEEADIILEVLDARDPMGCRCKDLEAEILGQQKKIILILNKIDLVPLEIAVQWQNYLKGEYACILFRANQQKQQKQLKKVTMYNSSAMNNTELVEDLIENSKASLGADQVIELIKNYSKNQGIKQAVTVGVVGYPNVGKSSLINSLKMSKAVQVSSKAGQTKSLQTICIDAMLTLIDSPGVIFDSNLSEKDKVLRNIIKMEQISDLQAAVQHILSKITDKQQLLFNYKISNFNDYKDLLIQVAQQRGKIQKKGIHDIEAAAKLILGDWMTGKIRYNTLPPNFTSKMELENI